MGFTIIVIPAEGDSEDTEYWYIKALKRRYKRANVLVYQHDLSEQTKNVFMGTCMGVRNFVQENNFQKAEIHAQGGLGAHVAYEFLRYCPEKISTVFMIGGAPCEAMTGAAKFFHRWFARAWYHAQWLVPFFADDPNPNDDEIIVKIKVSSTATMQENPIAYRNQLLYIGYWSPEKTWKVPTGCRVFYIPNGETVRSKLRDNTYDDQKAKDVWSQHGVLITRQPRNYFSFYSLMPAQELFTVMGEVR